RAPHDPAGAGRDPGPAAVEGLHRDLEPLAFLAHEIRLGELDVLEDHVGSVARALPELVLLAAHRDAGSVAGHDEAGDPLVTVARLADAAEDRVPVRIAGVGDPALLAGHHVLVADLANRGAHAGHVAARVGL